jgi:alpha-amylase
MGQNRTIVNFREFILSDLNLKIKIKKFYDHYIEWRLMKPIKKLAEIRKRNGITATSSVNILAAENDLYMAKINNKIIVKVGHKLDLGNLPLNAEIAATSGQDHALWEIK